MFGVGGGEILVIALIAVILFGTEDLPQNMRKFMKAWNNFRGMTNDLQRTWLDVRDQVTRDLLVEKPHHPAPNEDQADLPQASSAVTADLSLSGDSHHTEQNSEANRKDSPNELPTVRPAEGALPQGSLSQSVSSSDSASAQSVTHPEHPDKST
ncbi:hypothetical protein EBU99_01425 [bacterium]|nr:hypothetical protein [bacterium]